MIWSTRWVITSIALPLLFACSLIFAEPPRTELENRQVPVTSSRSYYVDPNSGSMSGDGSKMKPWRTLAEVFAAKLVNGEDTTSGVVHAGDVIYLLSGDHGSIRMDPYTGKYNNTSPITVKAFADNTPVINQLMARKVSKWTFKGITFAPAATVPPTPLPKWFGLATFTDCGEIVFDGNTLYSKTDVSLWSPQEWEQFGVYRALNFSGNGACITNNNFKNVRFGVCVSGDNLAIEGNRIDVFADDAIQFSSSNTTITGNVITNHYGKLDDGNHADGIQGWTAVGATGTNVIIDSNIIIASTGSHAAIAIPSGAGHDNLQGIGIFDGAWNDVIISNNVVAAAAFHGIGVYGLSDSSIMNNTVITQVTDPKVTAWIGVFPDQNKRMPANVVVRNNIAPRFSLVPSGVISDHNIAMTIQNSWSKAPTNIIVSDSRRLFETGKSAAAPFWHLKKLSPAIGAGSPDDAPPHDVEGRMRDPSRIDCGAYAYVVQPIQSQ